MDDAIYYIVKKNMDGVYLLDKRNEVIISSNNYDIVKDMYDRLIINNPSFNKYIMFYKKSNEKFLHMIYYVWGYKWQLEV